MIYLVTFKKKSDERTITSLGGKVVYPYKNLPRILGVKATEDVIESIENHPDVEKVEADGEDYELSEGQQESYAIEGMSGHDFWNRGYTGKGVKVAVFDSGCQPHEDLRIAGGYNARDPGESYMRDISGHGTHVAGIIGMRDNNVGYVGLAPECELYIIKLDDNQGSGFSISAQIEGINWCIENDIDIINMSFGGTTDHDGRREALKEAYDHGIVLVTSAGNGQRNRDVTENTITYPGKYDFVVTVANIQEDRTRYVSSSCGHELNFSAFGTDIMSTDIDEENEVSKKYRSRTGTSMASPYIAALFALYKQVFPDLKGQELIDKMMDNTVSLGSHIEYGYGLPQPPIELYAVRPDTPEQTLGGPDPNGHIKVYDLNFRPLAFLENAFNIGYEKNFNELWYASFSMPLDDPKNEYLQPFYYVEIYEDAETRVDLFRIMPKKAKKDDRARTVTYRCEHVLATLLDDVLFQYHQTTNLSTKDTLQYILGQQTVERWKLGEVGITRYFPYKWENENLLSALFSVLQPFDVQSMWTWDTTKYPWTLNLIEAPTKPECEIRYRKNLREIEREEDPTGIITRIYPLGYGEGVNQLTIKNVNNGKPYIDADTIDQYGINAYVFVDRKIEDENLLYNTAKGLLDQAKMPRLTYKTKAADVSKITGMPSDKLECGKVVRIVDDDFGTFEARIVKEGKRDVKGNPGDVDIEIINKKKDLADSVNDLRDRQRINEVYAQGATNLDTHDFAENADPDHPAVIRFYVPEEAVRINKAILNFRVDNYRAYSRATKGGGAIVTTTKSGGGTTVTSASGGGTSTTSGTSTTLFDKWEDEKVTVPPPGEQPHIYYDEHIDLESIERHTHSVTIPNHTHEVTIPDHSHEIELPDHTHDLEFGIFSGPVATQMTVEVDGNAISGLGVEADGVDIIPYLETDSQGRIKRGAWHEVKLTPNDLTRIEASIYLQFFIQSRGGTDA